MRTDLLVYLAGPLTATETHTVRQHVQAAATAYFDLISLGIPAFCPHLAAAFPEAFDIAYDRWLDYEFAIIDRCTHLVLLPGWTKSMGARKEYEYAFSKGKPVNLSVAEFLRDVGMAV